MTDITWDEIGQRFADLGRELKTAWKDATPDENTKRELQDAGERVKVAMDDLASTINRTAESPEVRESAKKATSGVAEALAATLRQAAEWLDRQPRSEQDEPRDAVPG